MTANRDTSLARWRMALTAALLVGTSGCGLGDGLPRYRVSGTVTYDGKLVPKGFITFTPDTSRGN